MKQLFTLAAALALAACVTDPEPRGRHITCDLGMGPPVDIDDPRPPAPDTLVIHDSTCTVRN